MSIIGLLIYVAAIFIIIILPVKIIKKIKHNQYLKERQIELLEEQNRLLKSQQKEV